MVRGGCCEGRAIRGGGAGLGDATGAATAAAAVGAAAGRGFPALKKLGPSPMTGAEWAELT